MDFIFNGDGGSRARYTINVVIATFIKHKTINDCAFEYDIDNWFQKISLSYVFKIRSRKLSTLSIVAQINLHLSPPLSSHNSPIDFFSISVG